MKIGILSGSFNPIHNGHIHLAEKVLKEMDIDEIWFLISPQNPFKIDSDLEDENHRLNMLEMSIKDNDKFKPCDVEMTMERPSYTYKTLRKLTELYPNQEFSLISGSDTINQMNTWKNHEEIFDHNLITFVRSDEEVHFSVPKEKLTVLHSDFDLSSTMLRERIKNNDSLSGLTSDEVIEYIKDHKLFSGRE